MISIGIVFAASTDPPHQFYGNVTYNGAPAQNGISVTAYIDGQLVESTTTSPGYYFIIIPNPENSAYDGKKISFFINNVDTGTTAVFGDDPIRATKLDLSANGPPPDSGSSSSSSGGSSSSGSGGSSSGSGGDLLPSSTSSSTTSSGSGESLGVPTSTSEENEPLTNQEVSSSTTPDTPEKKEPKNFFERFLNFITGSTVGSQGGAGLGILLMVGIILVGLLIYLVLRKRK